MNRPQIDSGDGFDEAIVAVQRVIREGGTVRADREFVINEVPVALVFNGLPHAVMMATPSDIEDYALGFSIAEGVVDKPQHVLDIDIGEISANGVEAKIRITNGAFHRLRQYRRNLAGSSSCGLCGQESLDEVLRPLPVREPVDLPTSTSISNALEQIRDLQQIRKATAAAHAAAWCSPQGEIIAVREDVGRHNALDKLIGWRRGRPIPGFVLVSSRASFELVRKSVMADLKVLVAVSAPTSLAIKAALDGGLRLVAFANMDRQGIYA